MNVDETKPPAAFSEAKERAAILSLCFLAAVHVFVFSAAFPFFNNVDENIHFDLVVKYADGGPPRSVQMELSESLRYIAVYASPEFLSAPDHFPDKQYPPPPWTQPIEKTAPGLLAREAQWNTPNYESSQPPLYYSAAALWWRAGKCFGLQGGSLLYWLRFLNIFFTGVLVWVGYRAARLVFPENLFLKLGVPALVAFIPQSAFYSIQGDVLTPLCFGAAFILLVKLLRANAPDAGLCAGTGLALALAFLAKLTTLPLLAVSGLAVLLKIWRLHQAGKLRAALPALTVLFFCVALPMGLWFSWCKYHFGDFTGSESKVQILGWTHKPAGEWLPHPIFTPHGFWMFISGLMATFWQGEFLWHDQAPGWPAVDMIYVVSSIGFVVVALIALVSQFNTANETQRQALWLAFWSFVASVGFLAFLSITYDYHNCVRPSRELPFFTSGRMILGALIPFLLLCLFALDCLLRRIKNRRVKPLVLAGMILFMTIMEIAINLPAFSSPYNWFHL